MEFISVTQDLIEIKKLSVEASDTEDIADHWLNSYNFLIGDTPLSLLNVENGANEIKKILSSVAYGGVA